MVKRRMEGIPMSKNRKMRNFRQELVHRRRLAIRDTIANIVCIGAFSYMTTAHSLWYIMPLAAFDLLALLSVIEIVRKTRGIKLYDSRPEIAYLVEIRHVFGANG